MKILFLNQCFYPDVVSTAQHLSDLAFDLSSQGHRVTVIASRRGYDNREHQFSKREHYRGVKISRLFTLNLGKQNRMRRAINFATVLISYAVRLVFTPRQDAVVALTSPPLISFLGALFVKLKGGRFYFWVMDLNPDEAVAAGWLKEDSLVARMLASMLGYSLRKAERIIVLDRFMQQRVAAKKISRERILVIPPWSHDHAVQFDSVGRDSFRAQLGLTGKFIVMYSGNHSPCHPLDTLLRAAEQLKQEKRIAFCFVGGGSAKAKVERFATEHGLQNIFSVPYQPLADVSASLSAADLHVIVMGDSFVGIVHPCKLYNVLQVAAPVLYIGPAESHITDLLSQSEAGIEYYAAQHDDVPAVVRHIQMAASRQEPNIRELPKAAQQFSASKLLPQITSALTAEQRAELKPSGAPAVSHLRF